MECRIVFLEFCAHEREEVVPVEKRFGSFREVFFMIGETVVPNTFAGVEEHVGVQVFSFGVFKRRNNPWLVEREDLIVKSVREFVEDDSRVLHELSARKEVSSDGDVNVASEAWIVAVIFEPALGRMILHGAKGGVFLFDPDGDCLELGERIPCDEDADTLEVVCEEGDRAAVIAFRGPLKEGGIDLNGPAFDGAFDGVETMGVGFGGGWGFGSECWQGGEEEESDEREGRDD